MAGIVRPLSLAVLLLAGCDFTVATTDPAGEPTMDGVDAGGQVVPPGARCNNAPVTDQSLVLCLDFDTIPGSDGSGRGHDPQVIGIAAGTRGAQPAAVLSASSVIQIAENPDLDLNTAMTIEMWMRPNAQLASPHDFYMVDNNSQYAVKYKADNKISCGYEGGASAEFTVLPAIWFHVGCTYDGASLKLYIDGELAACASSTKPIPMTGTLGTSIGAKIDPGAMAAMPSYKDHFEGLLDNVHVFSRALTTPQMCGAAGKTSCLVTTCPSAHNDGGGQ